MMEMIVVQVAGVRYKGISKNKNLVKPVTEFLDSTDVN